MRNRSDSAAQSTRSSSTSDLKRGMGIWVWTRRPAKVIQSHGDGSYDVEYIGREQPPTRVNRNDIDPMDVNERTQYLPKPRLEADRGPGERRTPLRRFMDEWPISRAQLVRVLGFSPPKVDRLIADSQLPLDVAVLLSIIFDVEVDPNVLHERDRPHLHDALSAAREGASEAQHGDNGQE